MALEPFGQVGKLEAMNGGSLGTDDFAQRGDHPEDAARLETPDKAFQNRARPDTILPPQKDRVEGLLDSRKGPRRDEAGLRLLRARQQEQIRQRRRRIYQEKPPGPLEL